MITQAESLAISFDVAFPVGGFLTTPIASAILACLGKPEDLQPYHPPSLLPSPYWP